jgi:uncharacterized protein YjdB
MSRALKIFTRKALSVFLIAVMLAGFIPLAPQTAQAAGVTVAPDTATLSVGQTVKFEAAASPSGEVVWSVADAAVASVAADGTVTALAPGQTAITAVVHGVSASAVITVVQPEPAPMPAPAPEPVPAPAPEPQIGIQAAGQTGRISGRITAADGSPVFDAHVEVWSDAEDGGHYSVNTDESGFYAITGLLPGTYDMWVFPPRGLLVSEQRLTDISVSAGGNTVIDITLPLGGLIKGTVTSEHTGLPLEDVYVQAECREAGAYGWGVSNEDGFFVLTGLPTGENYELMFGPPRYPGGIMRAFLTGVQVTAGEYTVLNVTMESGGYFTGTVTSPGGRLLEGAVIDIRRAGTEDVVTWAWTDETGLYITEGLPDGVYDLDVFPPYDSSYERRFIRGVTIKDGMPTIWNIGFERTNDHFANRRRIECVSGQTETRTREATRESGEPNHVGNLAPVASVWFTWTAPFDGEVEFNTQGSDFDTLLAVYTGTRLNNLRRVGSNDNASAGEQTSLVRMSVKKDTVYQIAIDGRNNERGGAVLNWHYTRIAVTGVTLCTPRFSMEAGSLRRLNATVLPENANFMKAFNSGVVWSSNATGVATVSADGTVTAVASGSARITATTVDGNKRAVAEVNVLRDIAAINITPEVVILEHGRTLNLNSIVTFANGTVSNQENVLNWVSDNPAAVSVSATGVLRALTLSEVPVTITGGVSQYSDLVTVHTIPRLRRIEASPAAISIETGQTVDPVRIMAVPHAAATTPWEIFDSVAWLSRNTAIATVSEDGRITAGTRLGRTEIVATYGAHTARITVHVINPVADLDPRPSALLIETGTSAAIDIRAKHTGDSTFGRTNVAAQSRWEVQSPQNISVSAGRVTALDAQGRDRFETSVTVTYGRRVETIPVVVIPRLLRLQFCSPVANIELGMTGNPVEVTAVYRDAAIAPSLVNHLATWSTSDARIATIGANGVITPIRTGRVTVTAAYGSQRASYTLHVIRPVAEIKVQPESVVVEAGQSVNIGLTARHTGDTALGQNNVAAQGKWLSYNTGVATVASGRITAVGTGEYDSAATVVEARYGNQITTVEVFVIPRLRRITAGQSSVALTVGGTHQAVINADYHSAAFTDGPIDSDYIRFSSANTAVATVDANGLITAVRAGTARITAIVGTRTLNINVTVR